MHAIVSNIVNGSIAEEAGIKKGDIMLSINKKPFRDIIDYMYYGKEETISLKVKRGDKTLSFRIKRKPGTDAGMELRPFRIKSCSNKCIFCFLKQLPKGMRKSLYVKDDDYRLSFLYGNYITLTNLTPKDKERIIEQKLSPLYISVHTTNNEIRRKILGNPKAPDIMKELQNLITNKIRIHAQIVLCPGVNDGDELTKTIKDLQKLYPYLASIAVVPSGLTKFSKSKVKPVSKADAVKVIDTVKSFRRRFKKRHGDPIAYLADEFYLKADVAFPSLKEYGDLPQLENGVGLIPLFLNDAKKLKLPKKISPRKIAVFTGTAFMPYLKEFSGKLNSIEGLSLEIFQVENRFFGSSVNVTGLLTGKDILKTIVGKTDADCLLVPDVSLREGSDVFLDNVTIKDMEESLGMNVNVIDPTPKGLLKEITDGCTRNN